MTINNIASITKTNNIKKKNIIKNSYLSSAYFSNQLVNVGAKLMKNVTSVYLNYTMGKLVHEDIIKATWGQIPRTIYDVIPMIPNLSKMDEERRNHFFTFMDIVKTHMKKIGIISHPILDKINDIQANQEFLGIFEIGHQPLLFGGGFFIPGKVSLLDSITRHVEAKTSKKALSIFFIGGHDRLHNELITTRFPQHNSANGLFLKFPTTRKEEKVEPPIYRLRKPPKDWIEEALEKMEGNFTQLIKHSVKPQNRPLLLERVQSAITLFKATWMQAESYADWIEKIWRDLFLFHCNMHVALLPVTDSDFNEFLLPSYEWLLKESTRTTFINVFNEITAFLENKGFKAALPYRDDDFVPFYLQCPRCELPPRLQPKISSPGVMEASCENCEQEGEDDTIIIEYNPDNPDLSNYKNWLLPRAESRTLSLCYLLPETVHVGGSGETSYHAQLFPIYRKLGVEPPIFVKTHRLYYTTPWTEKTNRLMEEVLQQSFLPNKQLFKLTRKIRKSKDSERTLQLQLELEEMIKANLQAIYQLESTLEEKLNHDPSSTDEVREKLNLVRIYASHFHGRFAPEQVKPDVSWNWSSIGILTGLHDITKFIQRNTNPLQPIGAAVFLSPGSF